MHTREVKIKNGVPTIIARHTTPTASLLWNGHKWVVDYPSVHSINEMMKAVLKHKKED